MLLPPAVNVQDGTDGAGRVGQGTKNFIEQSHGHCSFLKKRRPHSDFAGELILAGFPDRPRPVATCPRSYPLVFSGMQDMHPVPRMPPTCPI
jgi:hypothetical protein